MTRLVVATLLALVLPCATLAQYDADGDGRPDYRPSVAPRDSDNDACFDGGPAGSSAPALSDSLSFAQAWTSGATLNNQWDACCGYFDDDSLLDILGHHWSPNVLHVFESDGAGGYDHTWQQSESLPPGSYCTVTAGDPDDDGETELLGGEVSTLGKVVIFENVADDSWGRPYCGITMRNERIRTVRVADTNGNDTNEVVVVTGDATEGGKVAIFEHTGAPGVHAYTKIYEYSTVSYLFQAEVGDADNDGYPEILLGVGGMHGFPMNIRRIVYDPGTRTYSHRMFTSTVVGLPVAPMACDIDSSGTNELIVGSSGDPCGQVRIFRNAGDTFEPLWTSSMTTTGNVISVQAARFGGFGTPLLFAAPSGGAVYGFVKDAAGFRCVAYFNPGTGSAIRSIDYGPDQGGELVLAESAPSDFISVYRPGASAVAEGRTGQPVPPLRVSPNPCRGNPRIIAPSPTSRVSVLDACGRLVARSQGSFTWDRRRTDGRRAAAGVYLVRAEIPTGPASARLVIID
jgi:hypothetical protein